MGLLLMFHSILRWIIVVVALVAVVRFAMVWLGGAGEDRMGRGLMSGYTGLLDLQVTVGLILLLWQGFATETGFPPYRLEHMVTMLLAVVVAHLSARWRSAPVPLRARNNLVALLASLLLIAVGVARLPQGWFG